MKTIAVSIDEKTLRTLDRMVRRGRNRSQIVRRALHDLIACEEKREREERERAVLKKHRKLLEKQAEALVSEQARP